MKQLLYLNVFYFMSSNVHAHGITESAKQAMIEGGYLKYIGLGASHMLTGYDHLLFLFGVIFFLTTFKDIIKFISVFTLGHSITLIFATFMGISANYWLVDAVIAVSVCYKGFDNNGGFQRYLGFKKAPNLLIMVFLFGLIHGFGLSTRLQQLPLGTKGMGMFFRIISFNIGVEVGQIIGLSVMLIILNVWRKRASFERFSKVTNDVIIFCGFMLFLMQLHGYQHNSHPDDYSFSKDSHIHHHEEIYQRRQNQAQQQLNDHGHGDGDGDGEHKH
ncbi:MAG: HupE/UreJ family protein [Bacteriovoracaceae bacterium]|nr:HupE/UreJ family protein [Bacteriovoracaceae bacterium]